MLKNSIAGYKTKDNDNSKNELPGRNLHEKKSVGRKAKPASEKAGKPITLKFTESELHIIEEKSGLIPNATYLKELLLKQTSLFL